MIPPVFSNLFHCLLCINTLIRNQQNSYVVVVNLDLKLDFPSVRINYESIDNLSSLSQTPTSYVVNLDTINEDQLTYLLKKYGHYVSTIYIFIGQSWMSPINPNFSPEYFENIHFINYQNGEHLKGDNLIMRPSNCSLGLETTGSFSRNTTKVCFLISAPFVMPYGDPKKGIEIDIFEIILSMMKTEGVYNRVNIPGEFTGYIDFILNNGTCDIFSAMFPLIGNFDISYLMFTDPSIWVLKSGEEIPRWKYAFEVFSKTTWMLWVFSAVSLSIIRYIIRVLTNQNVVPQEGLKMFFKYFLEQSQSLNSKITSEMIFFWSLLFATFFMNIFYKSNFIFLLTGIRYEMEVKSLDEAMEQGFILRMSKSASHYFDDPKHIKYLETHYEEKSLTAEGLDKKTAQLMPEKMFYYQLSDYMDENGRSSIRRLDKPLIVMPYSPLLRKGTPLTSVLNDKFGMLANSGIMDWIFTEYSNKVVEGNDINVRKLHLSSIQLPIFLWVMGLFTSLLVFLLEKNDSFKIVRMFQ